MEYTFDILRANQFSIENNGTKTFYSTDGKQSIKDWYKDDGGKKIEYPGCSSVSRIVDNHKSVITEDSIGYFYSHSNCVEKNILNVGLFTMGFSAGQGNNITKNNFFKIVSAFTARKTITPTWINEKDEYLSPNMDNQNYNQFTKDSIVYSLFNNGSSQSSHRGVQYSGENWDIKNQFFWMSKEEMTNLANNGNYPELYNDARTDSDRYVHDLLFGEDEIYNQLSDEAKDVLDSASNLVRLSFGMRRNFADDTNHLNSWDAGYAQLKLLWKEYYPEQFKEFRDKYKVLEDKMRPMVYELGFLLK
jgi:hypothetical protein